MGKSGVEEYDNNNISQQEEERLLPQEDSQVCHIGDQVCCSGILPGYN